MHSKIAIFTSQIVQISVLCGICFKLIIFLKQHVPNSLQLEKYLAHLLEVCYRHAGSIALMTDKNIFLFKFWQAMEQTELLKKKQVGKQ